MLAAVLALHLNLVPGLAYLLEIVIYYDRRWGNYSTLLFLCRDLAFVF